MTRFTKMHALGNDFVVLDCVRQSIPITQELIQQLSDRHCGVGCDQVLIIAPTDNKNADFNYRIFNADGGEVFQCGNGARCVGLFIQQEKLSHKKIIVLETQRDLLRVQCLENQAVQADIAKPNFDIASLPFKTGENKAPYHLKLEPFSIEFDVVSVGNPHCVLSQNHFSHADRISIGEQLNAHSAFPDGVNVGFVTHESRSQIQLCVYERGVGITQACGSGACAAVAVGRKRGDLDADVQVHQAGGVLQVLWESDDAVIQLRGPAVRVFEGVLNAI